MLARVRATIAASVLWIDALSGVLPAAAQPSLNASAPVSNLAAAHDSFFNARYEEASALTLEARTADDTDLAGYELRSAALLFQLRRELRAYENEETALAQCAACPDLVEALVADARRGRTLAQARLRKNAADDEALFFLGKINLNYVWLQLGPLKRKKGWDEYWEARRSLDTLLKRNPQHVRGRVARAWIDYIVDTRMPKGTRWMVGGGNRTRALAVLRSAAEADAPPYVHAEARFALWDMYVRERNIPAATDVAQALALDFPENPELSRFLASHPSSDAATP